jgi:hypothetical protein
MHVAATRTCDLTDDTSRIESKQQCKDPSFRDVTAVNTELEIGNTGEEKYKTENRSEGKN